MRTTDYTKPNRPINFLPNSCVRDIKKPIWGLFTPWDQNIWAPPPLFRNQPYGTHTGSNLSRAETRNRGSNVAISTRQTILAHPCPPELDLMNMVIMGNHSINAARSNFLWFSPRYPPPSDSISTRIQQRWNGFFPHTHKNSSPTPLVCEGDLYGASCPPLLGSEQQRRGDNLYPLPIRGAPRQGPLRPLHNKGEVESLSNNTFFDPPSNQRQPSKQTKQTLFVHWASFSHPENHRDCAGTIEGLNFGNWGFLWAQKVWPCKNS